MKIKTLVFGNEKIILPKEIEVEYENGDNNAKAMWKTIKALVRELEQDQKKLKAFEIIKRKQVDVCMFLNCNDLDSYNYNALHCYGLTKEEFELLKEVLQ